MTTRSRSRRSSIDPPATFDLDPANLYDASLMPNGAVARPIIECGNLIDNADGRSRGAGDGLMMGPEYVALRSRYFPLSTINGSKKEQPLDQTQRRLSLIPDESRPASTTVTAATFETANDANVASSSSGVPRTHSIPFFKEGRGIFSLVPTRTSGNSGRRGSSTGIGQGHDKNRNSDGRSVATETANDENSLASSSTGISLKYSVPLFNYGGGNVTRVPTRTSGSSGRHGFSAGVGNGPEMNRNGDGKRIRRRSSTKFSSAIDSDEHDNWMEEALLNGISTANKKENVEYQPGIHEKASDDHHLTTPASEMDQKEKLIKSQMLSAPDTTTPCTQHDLHQQSRFSTKQSFDDIRSLFPDLSLNDLSSYTHSSYRGGENERKKEYPSAQFSSHNTSNPTSHYRQHGERTREQQAKSHSDSTSLMPPEPSLLSSRTSHPAPRNNDSLDAHFSYSYSNKSTLTLPTIRTYRLTKNHPDEPVGLFLTKTKNGAVLVHSLSPESPFLRSSPDPLSPGQEILSVNEKRINDPKMAARIITHAKKHLSLRVSTVKRGRGFMYCQVKRKNNGVGAEGKMDDSIVAAASPGTNTTTETVGRATVVIQPISGGMGVGKDTGTANSTPFHPGVRFVTTSVDGVRRGTATEGLVRVSHIDPQGLFASSNHMNLRVGSIVLTVNGIPVTNGKAALDAVMGSRQLIEVLHCDERVWRDAWVKDGLKQVLSEGTMEHRTRREEGARVGTSNSADSDYDRHLSNSKSSVMWDLEWVVRSENVILRKKRADIGNDDVSDTPNYAFRLIFSNEVGTCHSELVDDFTMMPPTEEFDVSLLVQIVNRSQRTSMGVLQEMLRKAHFELFGESESASDRRLQYAAAIFGTPVSELSLSSSRKRPDTRSDDAASNNRDNRHQDIGNIRRGILKKQEVNESENVMSELIKDENGGVDEELIQLANDLVRIDSRDRKRGERFELQTKQLISLEEASKIRLPRRGSETVSHAIAPLSPARIEQWRAEQWENQPTANKIRDFSARQHKMDQIYPSGDNNSRLSGFSLFSADMHEYFMDEATNSVSLREETDTVSTQEESDTQCTTNNASSPRNDAIEWADGAVQQSQSQESSEYCIKNEPPPSEKEIFDEEAAFITGVFRDVASKYEISDNIVGSGGFGEVRECYNKKTKKIYVVKSILKPERTNTSKVNLIRNEILLLHEAHHPNIIELQDLFEDDKYIHIVMERCTGGDLFDRVVSENPRQLRSHAEAVKYEARTAHVMRSILHVLKYLHSKSIVHRDIKPEHFLLTTDEKKTQKIKLIDFGLARKHKPGTAPMKTFTGSPSFVAPEVIARKYDHMCDMFSTGVTAYFLLTGMLPFNGPTDQDTFDLISEGSFEFPSSLFLSDDAKDFIKQLLVVNPKMRLTAGKALNHPWLLKAASC
jgi:tRNA A-37 threonylcarbamoyl transferase component Bud32